MKLLTTREFSNYVSPIDFYEAKNDEDGFWLTAGQIGDMLGYGNPEKSIRNIHMRNSREFEGLYLDEVEVNVRRKGLIKTTIYNFEGALKLCALAHKFRSASLISFLCESKDYIAQLKETQKSGLQLLNYNGSQIRTIEKGGILWWVAKDVADILEFKDAWSATQHLDDDEKGTSNISTLGGEQEMTIISESGLYALIMRSNKPEAKRFRKWVTSEVIPSIRKTGSYSITSRPKALSERIDKKETKFYSAEEIAKEAGVDLDKLEIKAHEHNITTYGFMRGWDWYFTEEGRDKLLELFQ